jgi:nucleoside diphosphate kinase
MDQQTAVFIKPHVLLQYLEAQTDKLDVKTRTALQNAMQWLHDIGDDLPEQWAHLLERIAKELFHIPGMEIVHEGIVRLSEPEVQKHYQHHDDPEKTFFDGLVAANKHNPIYMMVFEWKNAVEVVRKKVEEIRDTLKKWDDTFPEDQLFFPGRSYNGIHATDTVENAKGKEGEEGEVEGFTRIIKSYNSETFATSREYVLGKLLDHFFGYERDAIREYFINEDEDDVKKKYEIFEKFFLQQSDINTLIGLNSEKEMSDYITQISNGMRFVHLNYIDKKKERLTSESIARILRKLKQEIPQLVALDTASGSAVQRHRST